MQSELEKKYKDPTRAYIVPSIHLPSIRISHNSQNVQEETVYNEIEVK